MVFHTHIPRTPLDDFVELFWLYESYAVPHAMERVLPTGTIELVTILGDGARGGGPIVSGAHSQSFTLDTARPMSVIGVHFKPGGAFPFLGAPAGELHNAHVSLDALWGSRAAGELRDRLLDTRSAPARFRILEESLLARATMPLVRHPGVAFALREFGRVPHARTIADVTQQVALSPKRFIQVFRDQVGLTPKLFCRVRRFQEVLRTIQAQRQVEWADVAVACGHYDQAHFIADFRAFSGLNPTAYLRMRGEHLNHVPLVD
jgi:AraC-like DNA-binding protein